MESSEGEEMCLPSTHDAPSPTHQPTSTEQAIENQTKPEKASSHLASRLNSEAIDAVSNQILESKVSVEPQNQSHLKFSHSPVSHDNAKFSQIHKKKKQLVQELDRLDHEEKEMKETRKREGVKIFKSIMTKEQLHKIHEAIEARKELQEELEQKNVKLQEQIRQKIMEEKEEEKQRMEELNKLKKVEIARNLGELKERKARREEQIKKLNRNYQQVKKHTWKHEEMESKWKLRQKEFEQQDSEVLEELRRKKEFSSREILEHQKKYRSFVGEANKTRLMRVTEQMKEKQAFEEKVLTQYKPNSFMKTIIEEEKRKEVMDSEKREEMQKLRDQRRTYSQTIRKAMKDIGGKATLTPIQQHHQQNLRDYRSKSLGRGELAKLGNDYMHQMHSSIAAVPVSESKVISKKTSAPSRIKYHDYLQEQKRRRSEVEKNPEVKEIRELNSVMSKPASEEEKLYKAKIIATKLSQRAGSDTEMLLKSINTKLSIINKFTHPSSD